MRDHSVVEYHPVYRDNCWPNSYLIESLSGVSTIKRRAFYCLDYCLDSLSALDVNGQVSSDFYLNALSTLAFALSDGVERLVTPKNDSKPDVEVGIAVRVRLLSEIDC